MSLIIVGDDGRLKTVREHKVPQSIIDLAECGRALWDVEKYTAEEYFTKIDEYIKKNVFPAQTLFNQISEISQVREKCYKKLGTVYKLFVANYPNLKVNPNTNPYLCYYIRDSGIQIPKNITDQFQHLNDELADQVYPKGTMNHALLWDDVEEFKQSVIDLQNKIAAQNKKSPKKGKKKQEEEEDEEDGDSKKLRMPSIEALLGTAASNASINVYQYIRAHQNDFDDEMDSCEECGVFESVLHEALMGGSVEIAKDILNNFDGVDYHNYWADDIARHGHMETMQYMGRHFFNSYDLITNFLLHHFVYNYRVFGELDHEQFDEGNTPTMAAAEIGSAELIEFLFKKKQDVNQSGYDGITPLHVAAKNGHLEAVNVLLKHRAKFTTDENGETPRDYAEMNGHKEIVELLKKKKVQD
ncbi:hypothetical protein TVAG_417420 [Trichomonas vaginalis G3]|uniref:Uncharacterized protein n=1 Tax=Trichomonas vaginalis (strain ATCC PRA-98 / G3) TaxID=412133 RepID=A2F5Z4_TRIV3|nr:proteasome regulatory particle assembly [Trichomonas vaginalis G3]EAX99675.1 hypothetical protein TVAG_417420 [Trichomonas vaginalis G3]KAI5494337.1 proteasome regulatory particle assembly [Trichomonas vaginalis G3]|eukprot:XP_001312605.1 hypothetical protein [Trichomonas vaginalis G3]